MANRKGADGRPSEVVGEGIKGSGGGVGVVLCGAS